MSISLQNRIFRFLPQSLTLRTVVAIGVIGIVGTAWSACRNVPPPKIAMPPLAPLPSPNGYDDFRRAADLEMEPLPSEWAFDPVRGRTHRTVDRSAMRTRAQAVLAIVREGLAHGSRASLPSGAGTADRDRAWIFALARTVDYEAAMQEGAGDYKGAVQTRLDGIQFGVMIPRGGNLDAASDGAHCEDVARAGLREDASHLNADQAANAAHRLEQIDAMREPLARTLAQDAWAKENCLQEAMRTKSVEQLYHDVLDRPYVLPGIGQAKSVPSLPNFQPPYSGDQTARYSLFIATRSKWQIMHELTASLEAYDRDCLRRFPDRSHDAAPPSNDPILRDLLPTDVFSPDFQNDATRRDDGLLILELALRAFRLRRGTYPKALSALIMAGIIGHVPEDPCAKEAGTPISYCRLPNDLYTLGNYVLSGFGKEVTSLTR